MVITLVGLSGSGKSYLARRLAKEKGFTYIGCDDLIAKKLTSGLVADKLDSVSDVAQWMGEPYAEGFQQREAQYLELEAEVIKEVIQQLGSDGWGLDNDIVVDTTGSVIYLKDELLTELKKRSRIIYLSIPKNEYQMMFEQYFADPKPVIWGNSYVPLESEEPVNTLKRCYPKLIEWRASRYLEFAEMTMIMDRENRDRMSVTRLLQLAGAR